MQIAQQQRAIQLFPLFFFVGDVATLKLARPYDTYIHKKEEKEEEKKIGRNTKAGRLTVGVVKNRIIWMARHQSNI